MATPVAAQRTWEASGVRVVDVARQLRELRSNLGPDQHRALTSVMNLVAWAPSTADAVDVEQIADGLRDHHPSRAVIVLPGGAADRIDARVELIPHRGPSGREDLHVEQIVLTLHGAVVAHARSAVIPLLRSDLPTFLWWPAAPDPALPQFVELSRIADRLVTETGRTHRGPDAIANLAAVTAASSAPTTDLAWAVITPWRQLLNGSLRGEELLRVRVGAPRLRVTCPVGVPSLEALLLAGWLVDVIGAHTTVEFAEQIGDEDVLAVEIFDGHSLLIELRRDGPTTVLLTCPACRQRSLPLVVAKRRELIAGELELRGRDASFERALTCATTFSAR